MLLLDGAMFDEKNCSWAIHKSESFFCMLNSMAEAHHTSFSVADMLSNPSCGVNGPVENAWDMEHQTARDSSPPFSNDDLRIDS